MRDGLVRLKAASGREVFVRPSQISALYIDDDTPGVPERVIQMYLSGAENAILLSLDDYPTVEAVRAAMMLQLVELT